MKIFRFGVLSFYLLTGWSSVFANEIFQVDHTNFITSDQRMQNTCFEEVYGGTTGIGTEYALTYSSDLAVKAKTNGKVRTFVFTLKEYSTRLFTQFTQPAELAYECDTIKLPVLDRLSDWSLILNDIQNQNLKVVGTGVCEERYLVINVIGKNSQGEDVAIFKPDVRAAHCP